MFFIIADNQDLTRRGMHGFISDLFGAGRAEEVTNKRGLMQKLANCQDGLVILDFTLFDMNNVDEFLLLQKRFPQVRWLLFADELDDSFIRRVSVEKSVGMVFKDSSAEEIRTALRYMTRGERFLCHQITEFLISKPETEDRRVILTATETDVLKLIALGKSVKEIAVERTSSVYTIMTHKKNIFRKLGVNNVHDATKYALRTGLIDLVEYYI